MQTNKSEANGAVSEPEKWDWRPGGELKISSQSMGKVSQCKREKQVQNTSGRHIATLELYGSIFWADLRNWASKILRSI